MIDVVENSKDEVFDISEEARKEYGNLLEELKQTKEDVLEHIAAGDKLALKLKASRKRLSEVSKDFKRYSEMDIRAVYDNTYDMQVNLAMLRQKEKSLRDRRDDLERRLITLSQTIDRATGLASMINVILNYLYGEFQQVNEILEEAKEKQAFGLKVIEAQEEERRRISREIHDGPAQMLANILLRSELINKSYEAGSIEEAVTELDSVRQMIKTSLYEVRRIIYDLRPMALDDLGLIPTMKKYIANTAEYNKVKTEFITHGNNERLQQKYEIALFRLMQESLQNAIKHAEASLIKVKLEIGKQNIILVIQDNGKGFDTKLEQENSFGLIGMKERVEMLEGSLKIKSTRSHGTHVYIKIPY